MLQLVRMGVYLSTPRTEKLSENGENERLKFGLFIYARMASEHGRCCEFSDQRLFSSFGILFA
jgi:hypothetical protein